MSFIKNPSANFKFSRIATPKIFAALVASIILNSLVPLVPNSPLVKSMMPTFLPRETYFAMVAAAPSSTSSGCAPKASISNFINFLF